MTCYGPSGFESGSAAASLHTSRTYDTLFNLPHDGFIARLFAFLGADDNSCLEVVPYDIVLATAL
jgi:hypothetical protein